MKNNVYEELKEFCFGQGADLFGAADISGVKDKINLSKEITQDLDKAISLGVRLSKKVLDEIQDEPTKLYFHHYKTANFFLDQLAFKTANWIQSKNALALSIPASQIVDWQKQTAHLSHKHIGLRAGLGWIGRNNLLVNPKLGAQFRLVTILTNLEIKTDNPLAEDCGDCYDCLKSCPVQAIQKEQKDFKHLVCFEKLKEFQKKGIVGQYICGICVKACSSKGKEGKV